MRITQVFKPTSKNANYMHHDFEHAHGNIWERYDRPSSNKVNAWDAIINDYNTNNGLHAIQIGRNFHSLQYNNDCKIVGASSHFFSTIASFTDTENGDIYLIKETHCNTYCTKL